MPNRTWLLVPTLLALCLLTGCPQPSVQEIRTEQTRLLDAMETDAQAVQDPQERQKLLDTIASLRRELQSSHGTLETQQQELEALRRERQRYRLARELKAASVEMPFFSPVGSAKGLDLWVIPRDTHGDALKLPGALNVIIRRPGVLGLGDSPKLAEWNFSATQLHDKWAGQLYQGYHLFLPWPGNTRPDLRDAVVYVTFANPDGKTVSSHKLIELSE